MPNQRHNPDHDGDQDKRSKQAQPKQAVGLAGTAADMAAIPASGPTSTDLQAGSLQDPHLPLLQRQMLAGEIGQVHGNLHLQRVIQAGEAPAIQRDPDDLNLPETAGPSLDVGELSLDPALFAEVPLETTLAPDRLFQLPPELVESLVNEWRMQYILLHPGPPPAQDAWEQIWSTWRNLADEWLAQGEGAPFDRQLAEQTMRERAAEAVMAQLAGEEPDSGPDVGEIGGKVWQAFERALNETEFYPRLRANAEAALAEYWPVLVPLIGGAVGASLGLGLGDNEWGPMQRLTGLLPMLDHDFDLGNGWSLSLGFGESASIAGEEGSVIGANPQIGLIWENDNVRLNMGGFTNFRIEGETGDVHANPGANVTLDILVFE